MSDLKKQITQLYNSAALKQEFGHGMNEHEWRAYRKIQSDADQLHDQEIEAYRNEYEARVSDEVTRLIDEAGEFNHEHPAPFGTDKFNPNKITKQAERNVRLNHEATLEDIELQRVSARQELFDQSSHRQNQGGRARDAFTRSAEPMRQPIRGGPCR